MKTPLEELTERVEQLESEMIDLRNELREHIAIRNHNIQNDKKYCPYCGTEKDFIVSTDANSGRTCKNRLCEGRISFSDEYQYPDIKH